MDALGTAQLYVEYRRLRLTGSDVAARKLIDALGSSDENLRMLAGMFLVRAAHRSVPVLIRSIEARHPELPTCLTILGDIGGEKARAILARYTGDPDRVVAQAATGGLATIAMREKLDRGEGVFTLKA